MRSMKVKRGTPEVFQAFKLQYHHFYLSESLGALSGQILWPDYPTSCMAISSKSTTKMCHSNITQKRSTLLLPISQLLSNCTFLKVPHTPMSASPEPVNHETPAQSPPSHPTSWSSIVYAGDVVVSSPYFDNWSQDSLLQLPSTQCSLPPASTQVWRKEYFPTAELFHSVMSSSIAKVCDFIDIVNAILVWTMFEFKGLVSTHDAFPSPALCHEWAPVPRLEKDWDWTELRLLRTGNC